MHSESDERKGALVVLRSSCCGALAFATTVSAARGQASKAAGPSHRQGRRLRRGYRAKASTLAKTLFQAKLLP
jgi:hypothetical protein